MTVSLIISTYNSSRALELCLKSVLRQSTLPDEVLIADDGSGEETIKVIKEFQEKSPVPIIHVWHEDNGFRLTVIRNKAIAKAGMDYIIQIDGDIILNRHFIKDHKRFARKNSFVSGSRLNIQPELSKKLITERSIQVSIRNKGVHNRLNGIRWRLLTWLLQNYHRTDLLYVRGCNMGFWRSDLLMVNGYDENMIGWGREDSEIACRLINAGIRKRIIKNAGIVFHLYHQDNSRAQFNINNKILQRTIDEKRTWCAKGVDQYLAKKKGSGGSTKKLRHK